MLEQYLKVCHDHFLSNSMNVIGLIYSSVVKQLKEQRVKAIHLFRNSDVNEQPNKQWYVDIQEVCCSIIHLSAQYEYDLGVETFCI
jgi:hypothetical protein